ncbi:MAG: lipid-A-disaccharide synthase, partial [Notoacmeibacter sp.]|nr:lipid-A-disaccharide synthase [Notoacmeibacter sp.]
MSAPLKIAVVTGEESGDLLAADLVAALARKSGRPIELMGVGGGHLAALGLTTLFDPSSIALMGISAV